ncbi:hypothetical protein AAHH80_36550, partial [Burkholderia pseudomallei]
PAAREAARSTDRLLRLAVGLEEPADSRDDLARGLAGCRLTAGGGRRAARRRVCAARAGAAGARSGSLRSAHARFVPRTACA